MTTLDVLSDTVYREQANMYLDQLIGKTIDGKLPVKKTQIYGLREIARKQPHRVIGYAKHQRDRAETQIENCSRHVRPKLQNESDFWKMVESLCISLTSWSVRSEGIQHLPSEICESSIPQNITGMTQADRAKRKQLKQRQKEFLDRWTEQHVPAFFERFCTHALYRLVVSGH